MNLTCLTVAALLISAFGLAAMQSAPPSTSPAGPGTPGTPPSPSAKDLEKRDLHTFEVKSLDGKPAKLSQYEGKALLIVNLASDCGYTPQYEELEKLSREFKEKGLVVLGFPCNDFGGQEPGTAEEIRAFCDTKYHVTFPLFEKVSVKPGDSQSTLYKALEARTGKLPTWNFCKYVVGRDGVKAEFFDSKATPESTELREAIQRALAAK
jgi:glutathione peroxidase